MDTFTLKVGDDETIDLKPDLAACKTINGRFGGLVPAAQRVQALDVEAITFIVATGSGGEPAEVRAALFRAGLQTIAPDCARFVEALANGGRDPGPPVAMPRETIT